MCEHGGSARHATSARCGKRGSQGAVAASARQGKREVGKRRVPMQIFCDESGGADPANDLFLAAAVAILPFGATRLLKSFRKATAWKGSEVKGHRLSPEQRRVFFDLLVRQEDLGSVVVSGSRRTPVGGWAMGALSEPEPYVHLLREECVALVPAISRHVTITPDGGRYKRSELRRIARHLATEVRHRLPTSPVTVSLADSASTAGLQVADVVANTAFQAQTVAATLSVPRPCWRR